MIEVLEYQPDWKLQFLKIKEVLLPAVFPITSQIEHVGSTSVAGLCAKPIIDIDIIIKSKNDFDSVRLKLLKIGYKHMGDQGISGREYFRSGPSDIKHHLYVCVEGTLALQNHLLLRNHLRGNEKDKERYGLLKKELSERYENDIDAYVEGKTEFIVQILSMYVINGLDEIRIANKK